MNLDNTIIRTEINEPDLVFHDVKGEPFKVYGLYDYKNQQVFKRLPDDVAESSNNDGVKKLYLNTAGGRVRFATDSKYIAIKSIMQDVEGFSHMPLTGVAGFDLFIDYEKHSTHYRIFKPPYGMKEGYESIVYLPDARKRSFTIYFPLFANVSSLYIGVQKEASLSPGLEYTHQKPVVFYGSSITQGGCASRPGNSYQSIISRDLDCDFINLGFSGSARGEEAIADYISKIDSQLLVFDYDHNAPSAEFLSQTQEKFFKAYRKNNPYSSVIFVSRPDFYKEVKYNTQRRNVIYSNYLNAVKNGDENVYFINGAELFQREHRDCCTVDGTHPNDLGFLRMAEVIGYEIKKIFESKQEFS